MEEEKTNPSFLGKLQARSRNLLKKLSVIKAREIQIRQTDLQAGEETRTMIESKTSI